MDIEPKVVRGDALEAPCDVLVLKFADYAHGVDLAAKHALGEYLGVNKGNHKFFATKNRLAAGELLVLGVGPLSGFEYQQIEMFGAHAIDILRHERPAARRIAFTLHGPGYGLDELACFDSLLKGIRATDYGRSVEVIFVEANGRRAKRLSEYLDSIKSPVQSQDVEFSPEKASLISNQGSYSRRLFTAMPFKQEYLDHWELAIQSATHAAGFLCERLDYESFTGDIVGEIRNRIEKASGVIGVLDDLNANVFLEVGYAWGVGKPTVLVLHERAEAPFDVKGQRIIRYSRLGELKTLLEKEIAGLSAAGVFAPIG